MKHQLFLIRLLFVPLLVLIVASSHAAAAGGDADSLLRALDQAVIGRGELDKARFAKVRQLKTLCETAPDDSKRYKALGALYGAYAGFQIDSALNVAVRLHDIARRYPDEIEVKLSAILLAQSYSNAGNQQRALAILDTLRHTGFDAAVRERYYSACFTAWHCVAESEPVAETRLEARKMANSYRDSIIGLLPPGSAGHYYLNATRLDDMGLTRQAIALLEEAQQRYDFSGNAAFQYGLGTLYLKNGAADKALEAIARASLLDICAGKKEYMSMIKLARLLYDRGDIMRAFSYMRCVIEDVGFSHAEIRAPELIEILPIVDSAYRSYEQAELEKASRHTAMAMCFGGLMIVCLALLWLQLRRISHIRRQLDESNRELSVRNRQLARSDAVKLKHIDGLLHLHASNIAHTKVYRQTLYRLMKAGQYPQVVERLKTDKLATAEVKEFNDNFDATFLSIFPSFIKEVNEHMQRPVAQEDMAELTPELRIIALMKLGITSTSEIAAMLQYSPQTVYNYRSSIRAMLNCPLDEFERKIGLPPGSDI